MESVLRIVRLLWGGALEVVRPGESELSGGQLARFGRIFITLVILGANGIGVCAVLAIALFVVPLPALHASGRIEAANAITAAAYVAFAFPVGAAVGTRRMLTLRRWLSEDRPATPEETRIVLHAPLRLFTIQVGLWFGGAIVFGALNLVWSYEVAERVVVIIVIAGLVTAACAYLMTELLLRPAAARALAHGTPGRLAVPGVATRAVLAWALGTGLPVAGVVAVGILGLQGAREATPHRLGIAMVVLGSVGIAVGLLAVTVAARATADPVDSVRRALRRVQSGDFDVRVPVYDATQIGQLQLGFNEMVAGLAERERIREAFGTYVDPDVAQHILSEGTRLEGEQVEVTLMFIDIRDFTGFAERTSAADTVAAINELFEQIVPIIQARGGRVDKFIGDGLLAVFGAPRRQPEHADQALEAALEIASTVHSSQGLEFGIGLNSGTVVAGNVGGAGRLEFSVIGDPVNIAARVEAATRQTGDTILLAERTRDLLTREHPPLTERAGIELRGKTDPVRVYAPECPPADRPHDGHTNRAPVP